MIKKKNPIIRKYVTRIRSRLSMRRLYYKKKGYYYKNKKQKKIRNPIIKRYVSKLRKRLRSKKWYEKNREKQLEYKTKWRKNNKEKINEYFLKRIHIERKNKWVRRGLITDNIDEVYKRYEETTNCDLCNIFLEGNGYAKKCMDHSHTTGLFRNILCSSCNCRRGEDRF